MSGKMRARAAQRAEAAQPAVDRLRSRHMALGQHRIVTESGVASVTVNEAESPLTWLARRRGRDGRPLIAPHQLQAGERLRADFTRASLMPRTTSNWSSPLAAGRNAGGGHGAAFTETMMTARQRVRQALDAVGPEFAGCCLMSAAS